VRRASDFFADLEKHIEANLTTWRLLEGKRECLGAVRLRREAAASNHAGARTEANYRLGNLMDCRKPDEALAAWRAAADQGRHAGAIKAIAEAYANGDGDEVNEAEAFAWYIQTANEGDADAQLQAARYRRRGGEGCCRGVQKEKHCSGTRPC